MATIRRALKSDALILSELGAKTFHDTFRPYHPEEDIKKYLEKTYNLLTVENNFDNPEIIYLIAEEGDQAIGYVKLIMNSGHEELKGKTIELEKIYVLNTYLGTGTGAELMKSAINLSKERRFEILFLGVWQENKRAVKFYFQFGFEVFTTRKFQLGTEICDDYLMKLVI